MTYHENKDIQAGDIVVIKLPHEEIEREFIVKKLDNQFKNLPIIDYNGGELLIDRKMILRKIEA